ncbi:hypothetical protein GDO81_021973 [Engystomops pustulosus]|uniref:Olfactory receptor n=1 Tax=Engystomops pustulosus TaxID=76066 RepID=A0AAV6Z4T7_ENGPU|nr:hypothetical protein GDO81_030043 [Engystomops pustulosus]KAG8544742.1 hypothetical protein GDO81_021973 [Engystomops pustulosus]
MSIEKSNITSEPVFYIFAFSTTQNQRVIILVTVLLVYLIILSGNLLIIALICLEPRLHTPMYFFLCNLYTLDIMFVSTTLPKLMYICLTGDHVMSYTSCMAQMYLSVAFGDTESFLLTSMAIDRYVAVCFPLHYSLIMSKKICGLQVFPAWFMSLINAFILTYFTYNLSYFELVEVKNFFCELKSLMNVSISDATSLKISITVAVMYVGIIPSCMILASYVRIIHTVQKIKSSAGRWKTFSSCSSHITIVVVFYGSWMTLYLSQSLEQELILSLMFVTLVPMLNPLVYSLRNKDITEAIRRRIDKKISCSL